LSLALQLRKQSRYKKRLRAIFAQTNFEKTIIYLISNLNIILDGAFLNTL
jgi:hypothetical protein